MASDPANDRLKRLEERLAAVDATANQMRRQKSLRNAGSEADSRAIYNAVVEYRARIAALEAELAEAKAERDEMDALYHEGGTWEQQLSAAEARATAAEARAEKMAEALEPFKTAIEAVPIQGRKFVQVIMTGDEIAKIFAALGRPE